MNYLNFDIVFNYKICKMDYIGDIETSNDFNDRMAIAVVNGQLQMLCKSNNFIEIWIKYGVRMSTIKNAIIDPNNSTLTLTEIKEKQTKSMKKIYRKHNWLMYIILFSSYIGAGVAGAMAYILVREYY